MSAFAAETSGPAPSRRARPRSERGTAMVEMAVVFPLIAGLVFGFVDLGRAYRLQTSLTNAAHEGASYARYNPTQVDAGGACADPNNITFATRNEQGTSTSFTVTVKYTSQSTESPPATWTPVVGCNSSVPAARVVVTASAPFQLLTPLVSAIVGQTITLSESSEVVVQ